MRFLPVNAQSFLLELASLDETLALFEALNADPLAGIAEIIPAARTLLIRFNPRHTSSRQLAAQLARYAIGQRQPVHSTPIVIPVRYDGEDLASLAEQMGISAQTLIQRHQQAPWHVAFTGFAPGFAYMVAEEGHWQTPRRSTPRTRIPPGSVALAAQFSGIYPQASPGGWQLIGRTALAMWQPDRDPPALLVPGGRVCFVDESRQPLISLPAVAPAAPNLAEKPPENSVIQVQQAGLMASFQDQGRTGKSALGLSPSGALDQQALHTANRIVGNPPHTPALEITFGGFIAHIKRDIVLSLTGAPCPIRLHTRQGQTRALACYRPINLTAGDELHIGAPTSGVRSYLALRGGFQLEAFQGAVAFDSLAKVGIPPLQPGAQLIAADQPCQPVLIHELPPPLPAAGDTVTLDIWPGPRTDWFTPQALALLVNQRWQVTPQSDRIGLRLAGDAPLSRRIPQELPSEGVCRGALQVPASGQPILFMNDHPLTGGYPVIAVLAEHHLDLAGQIPPAAYIRFNCLCPFAEIDWSLPA